LKVFEELPSPRLLEAEKVLEAVREEENRRRRANNARGAKK
jgi:hypothetical protein